MQKAHFHSEHVIINVKKWYCDTHLLWIKPENAQAHKAKKKGQHPLKKINKTSPKMARDKDEEHKELNIKRLGNRIKATMMSLKYMQTQR